MKTESLPCPLIDVKSHSSAVTPAHITNEEIRLEFARSVREVKRDETIRRVRESEQLI